MHQPEQTKASLALQTSHYSLPKESAVVFTECQDVSDDLHIVTCPASCSEVRHVIGLSPSSACGRAVGSA